VSGIQLESLPEPSAVGQTRIAGIDFNRTRTLQVARAVLALSVRPKGFTASQLAEHVRRQTNTSSKDYGPRQEAYDLKKFRGKELVRLIGKSRRYEPTANGLRLISGLMVSRERVLEPLTRGIVNVAPPKPAASPTSLDQRYEIIREQMHEVLLELALAA
jgi:hypothetical protein